MNEQEIYVATITTILNFIAGLIIRRIELKRKRNETKKGE
jgi:hypothetical protein